MKPRYYVKHGINKWLVLDRLKIKMHNDTVAILASRKAARDKAKELNNEERQDRTVDQQLTVDGELI
jgi:hypothetical protein